MVLNTTNGPREVPRGHIVNTSRVVEEDLSYEDEEPEIAHVLNATGWVATFKDGRQEELIFWCVLDDATVHGIVLGEDGLVDLTEGNVEKVGGFVRYEQTNETKEKTR